MCPMRMKTAMCFVMCFFAATAAQAECTGSNGRGWASGKGNGQFEMVAADKVCQISFPGFVNDSDQSRIAAKDMTLTRAPKSGKMSLSADGPVYTPNAGFKGKDKFCTKNTSPQVPGKSLSGCITITVN